ncbi:MAG: GNAT family N-acetyltransferase [Flavobacteriales bacterium]|nr:GNAT family N-acetyltransferase [Flavobacteriales bacterium]HRO39339.1 GNAT family N-acetyltransferase [Flavobacteriales bacterium]HRP80776.1 GNAT family N-acetyltransferase [Flavobacteriales bacterium]
MRPVFLPIPRIATQRLLLRELEDADAPAVLRLRSDPALMRFIPKPLFSQQEEASGMISEFHQAASVGEAILWGITVRGTEGVAGYIGFWRIMRERRAAELGYALHPDLWGQGLATEAVAAVVAHGFAQIGLQTAEAQVTPENAASIHVLERNGFVFQGEVPADAALGGPWKHALLYSKTAADRDR